MNLLTTALRYHQAGLTVLPNDPVKKYPVGVRGWETITPTEAHIRQWFSTERHAIGIRDREGLDFDNKGHPSAEELYHAWSALVDKIRPGLVPRLLCERTPSGGFHVVWRCETIQGNQKVATRPPTPEERQEHPKMTFVTLIETRGQGGQFQVAPSPGYTLLRGDWAALPLITTEERQDVLDCARALSLADTPTLQRTERENSAPYAADASERPGDIYNQYARSDVLPMLEQEGWHVVASRGDAVYLCRPGKRHGVSATLGYVAPGVLYVFSSNASPFEAGRAYTPFAIYTHLKYAGDFRAAASSLAQRYRMPTRTIDAQTGEIRDTPPLIRDTRRDWRATGITLSELQHKQFEPERWVVESLLPEGACIFAAKYKSRKSWLALAVALAVAMNGRALGQLAVSSGRVLYLDLEGKQARIQKRTGAILGVQQVEWPSNFHIYTKWPQGDEGMLELEHWFASYPDTALVVIDVLASFRRPMQKNEDFYRYDRDTVDPINELFERHKAAGLLVHHFNKGKHDDIMDSITGSTGLPSAVNSMWGITRDPNNSELQILHIKGRDYTNEDPLSLRWDHYLNMHIIEGSALEISMSDERRAILSCFADESALTPKDIAMQLGVSVPSVQKQLTKLLNERLIDKVGYGKYARIAQSR